MTNVFFELTTVMKTMEHAQILLVAGLVLVIQAWKCDCNDVDFGTGTDCANSDECAVNGCHNQRWG